MAFLLGVVIRRNRGMAKASRLARTSPSAFSILWGEGALSLKVAAAPGSVETETNCGSPEGDYRQFVAQHFLRSRSPDA